MLTIKMALRNLRRNLRRSIITASAISLGLGMLMFSSGGTDGMTNRMIEKGVGGSAGHVVIQAPGWQEEREARDTVPDSPAVAAKLQETLPEALIVKRVFLDGLLTSPQAAMGVAVLAVEPEREAQVSEIDDKIVAGSYLDGDGRGIVLGKTLAESLDVELGDKVVLMSQGEEDLESRLFRVKGIYSFGVTELDGSYAQIELASAQEMLGLGDAVNQISAHLPSARDTELATAAVQTAFAGAAVDVLPWQQALPDLADYVAAEQGEIYVMYFIIFFMVGLGIVNTVLMSVMERLREFGVMLSLGATPARLARLVLTEAVLLGFLASLLGVGIGLLFNWPLWTSGIDMSGIYGGSLEVSGLAMDMIIYGDLSALKTLFFALFTWGLTVVAAFYPAYKAATLKPVDCLQHQ